MRRLFLLAACLCIVGRPAEAQNVIADIMSGKLINPEVGVFAWYELKDAASGARVFLRQAIVGSKKVGDKEGFYLETEVLPEIGFPIVYKMLLTGPATDPANVHEVMVKDGMNPPETVPLDTLQQETAAVQEGKRESQGKVTVETLAGPIEAEHFVIDEGEHKSEVWVNDTVRPMGIVKMIAPEGELILTRHGTGGSDAESVLDRPYPGAEGSEGDVKVRVDTTPTRNFSGRTPE